MPNSVSPLLVRVLTTEGELLIEIDAERAPASAAGFLRYVDEGRYVGGAFTRTVNPANDQGSPPICVIQAMAADPSDPLRIVHEPTTQTGLSHLDGVVSLPRLSGQGGSATGFVVCIGDQPGLDAGAGRADDRAGLAAFGRLIDGGEVARRIHQAPTRPDAPHPYLKGQVIEAPITILAARREPPTDAGRLKALAEDYWAFRNSEFPIEASAAGVPGHGHRLDTVDLTDHARRAEVAVGLSRRLGGVDTGALSPEDAATRALLANQLELMIEAWRLGAPLVPQLYLSGFHDLPMMLAQSTPLNGAQDIEGLLARLEAMPGFFAANIALIEAGAAQGYRLPRPLLARVRGTIAASAADSGLKRVLGARLAQPPSGLGGAAMVALRVRVEKAVEEAVLPALRAFDAFLEARAEALCWDSTSVCDQPGGEAYYRFKVRQQTTTELTPEEIHQIGLNEIARIQGELQAVLGAAGFKGAARAYADALDTRVEPSGERLLERARALAKRIDGRLPRIIGRLPRLTYGVEPFTAEQSINMPPALAEPGPPDCTMAGVYWLTALPERCPNHLLAPLTLHEAWPGHLMQFALAHELADLPAFRRACWSDYNGYVEGWALYCERLGHDLGLYEDPADHFGALTFDLWRAARLVVDTGLHWYRWERAKAVAFMAEHTFMPAPTIETEVDRYIGMPAQALSYKIGERAIRGLRAEAEAVLGERFSLRAFHDAILATGPVSLPMLEAAVRAWIDAERGRNG
ncbi:MAG: DUF885 family protein [Caulobacteraceae bacterium]